MKKQRQLGLEHLEIRNLLAANSIAQFDGMVTNPNDTQHLHIVLRTQDFNLAGNSSILGFRAQQAAGSTLDPSAVQIHSANGNTVTPVFSAADLPGSTDSVVLADLTYGSYTVDVSAQRGTAGTYHLDVFLVGDANGDHAITTADGQKIQSIYGVTSASSKYAVSADANLDGAGA